MKLKPPSETRIFPLLWVITHARTLAGFVLPLLAAALASPGCSQGISLAFVVPSKGKLGKEESKTSLVGMRYYGLIGRLGVSCWLLRRRLKTLCWSQVKTASALLVCVMTDGAALVTVAS